MNWQNYHLLQKLVFIVLWFYSREGIYKYSILIFYPSLNSKKLQIVLKNSKNNFIQEQFSPEESPYPSNKLPTPKAGVYRV